MHFDQLYYIFALQLVVLNVQWQFFPLLLVGTWNIVLFSQILETVPITHMFDVS